MMDSSLLQIGNVAFLDALYLAYRTDPNSVDPQWREFFAGLGGDSACALPAAPGGVSELTAQQMSELTEQQMKVVALINANRYRGHRGADIDPIRVYERPPVPDLYPEHFGFGEGDLDRLFNTGTLHIGKPEATLREIHDLLRDTYRGSIGTEVTHLSSTEQKRWVQERLERCRGRPNFDTDKKRDILGWSPRPASWRTTCTASTSARSGSRSKAARTSFRSSTKSSRTPGVAACARRSSAWPIAGGSTCW